MSGSPKYHEVRRSEQRRRRAEQERKERERQRREEERRRKEEALRRAIAAATTRVDEVADRLEAIRGQAVAAGEADRAEAVARDLAGTRRSIASAGTEKALREAGAGIERAERGIADLQYRVNVHKQRQAADRIAVVADLLSVVPADVRARFDRGGHDEVDEQLARARRQARHDPAGAAKRADALAQRTREHIDTVLVRRHEHESRVAVAVALIEDIDARLAVLEAESSRIRIPAAGMAAARAEVTTLEDALHRGDLDAVHAGAAPARARVAGIERELDTVIDRVVERRQVLESIVAALPETGFEVDQDSLREGADGSLELRAYSGSGRAFAVLVGDNPDGLTQVRYTTDSMAGEVATGQPGRSCGPLLEIIGRLSEEARNNGFEPGTVRWDDDPDRPPPGGSVHHPGKSQTARGAS